MLQSGGKESDDGRDGRKELGNDMEMLKTINYGWLGNQNEGVNVTGRIEVMFRIMVRD